MKASDFIENVNRIVNSLPTYRTGGTGADGTCDCIGLIMGAMYALGHKKYDLHSTNYFARYEMDGMYPLTEWQELKTGDLVYKYRPDNGELNERYKPGGTHDTGDPMDYYHVGIVTSINPLEITHCTQTNNINGIARDTSIKGWDLYGQMSDLEYEDQPENEQPANVALAIVYSESGDPVRMRKTPTTTGSYNTITKVPKGAQVEVLETDGVWSNVRWNGQRGYMMSRYLRVIGMTAAEPEKSEEQKVNIRLSANAAAELYKALSSVL